MAAVTSTAPALKVAGALPLMVYEVVGTIVPATLLKTAGIISGIDPRLEASVPAEVPLMYAVTTTLLFWPTVGRAEANCNMIQGTASIAAPLVTWGLNTATYDLPGSGIYARVNRQPDPYRRRDEPWAVAPRTSLY